MPLIDLTYSAGTIGAGDRPTLVEELTTKLLHWEGAPDNEFFRSIAWVHVHELPGDAVNAAGAPVSAVRLDVTVPEGALSDRRKAGLVDDLTRSVYAHSTLTEADGIRVWVLIREVPDGNWGGAGQVVRFGQLRETAQQGAPVAASA
jgi:phenylpyruvate tautomerase PptA (4-oxalocrotonate tautomerase family)